MGTPWCDRPLEYRQAHNRNRYLKRKGTVKEKARQRARIRKHYRYWVGIDGEGRSIRSCETHGDSCKNLYSDCDVYWQSFPEKDKFSIRHCRAHNDECRPNDDNACDIYCKEHKYISLVWSNADGSLTDKIVSEQGLTTKQCLNFILSIPKHARIAGFAIGYDLTKILEEMPNEKIRLLTHPDLRPKNRFGKARKLRFGRYRLDLVATRLEIGQADPSRPKRTLAHSNRSVNDVFKFFGTSFVKSLKNWQVGTPEELARIQAGKEKRSDFDRTSTDYIVNYSLDECRLLAQMFSKVYEAHEQADLPLTQFYGAGSTASVMLEQLGIDEQAKTIREITPGPVQLAASYAFFGGRFEIARRGEIPGLVHDFDISSAYPYQISQLPCLTCGTWTLTRDIERARHAQAALIRYELAPWKGPVPPWGPFPFRQEDGSIPYPIESGGGWVHQTEFFAAQRLFPNVKMAEAWVYETACKHRPFAKVPEWYLTRLAWGKEGRGYVLKLGMNSIYGKLAQIIGSAKYQCRIWAGMVTAGCRAQLLDFIGQHERWSDILMLATDGVWSLCDIKPHSPRDTGTDHEVFDQVAKKTVRKPLGAWEHGHFKHGVFMARPGIYFPLQATDDQIEEAKARGIGTKDFWKLREEVRSWFQKHNGDRPYWFDAGTLSPRFIGLRSGITAKNRRRDEFGKWVRSGRFCSFAPAPKRQLGNAQGRLDVLRLDPSIFSKPYDKDKANPIEEGFDEKELFDDIYAREMLDQPDLA